ncbi:DUF721 domain-containing protein [Thermosulfurimonas marina]|uniref:DUF721 domain-containing protein n=1 Tax=Thermosulfurimonas marina TaxID=2047767 RepID=A0A6H1WU73_9BACT|nr:DUF721 domain-containing protein [Thermosulfurimonas marina]QJA06699.1 DUF721 domain-containing protein [Thermosulfurimonas marina]
METLGRILHRLFLLPGWRERLRAWEILWDWEEIVGEEVASRTWPLSFAQGRLTLGVTDSTWASALRFEVPRLLELLNQRAGERLFREIRFQITRPPGKSRPRNPRRPLTPEEKARIEASVQVIEDPELREVFKAWGQALLRAGRKSA